jgi:hypothetical protein
MMTDEWWHASASFALADLLAAAAAAADQRRWRHSAAASAGRCLPLLLLLLLPFQSAYYLELSLNRASGLLAWQATLLTAPGLKLLLGTFTVVRQCHAVQPLGENPELVRSGCPCQLSLPAMPNKVLLSQRLASLALTQSDGSSVGNALAVPTEHRQAVSIPATFPPLNRNYGQRILHLCG